MTRLLAELEKQVAANPDAWRGVSERSLSEIAASCAEVLANFTSLTLNIEPIVDPVSGLSLPPPQPEVLYKNRASKFGTKVSPEEFISRTLWSKYRDAGLLYSEFIRQLDPTLYNALVSKAQYQNKKPSEIFDELGLLSRWTVDHPHPDFVRQARLIRAARVLTSSKENQQAEDWQRE